MRKVLENTDIENIENRIAADCLVKLATKADSRTRSNIDEVLSLYQSTDPTRKNLGEYFFAMLSDDQKLAEQLLRSMPGKMEAVLKIGNTRPKVAALIELSALVRERREDDGDFLATPTAKGALSVLNSLRAGKDLESIQKLVDMLANPEIANAGRAVIEIGGTRDNGPTQLLKMTGQAVPETRAGVVLRDYVNSRLQNPTKDDKQALVNLVAICTPADEAIDKIFESRSVNRKVSPTDLEKRIAKCLLDPKTQADIHAILSKSSSQVASAELVRLYTESDPKSLAVAKELLGMIKNGGVEQTRAETYLENLRFAKSERGDLMDL
ncbi:MAG: hypothetical protein K2Z81_16185, partial [Cyanobacteria bacterium]|nr:hypothetical protein [Cyanobacteriota bacterium]